MYVEATLRHSAVHLTQNSIEELNKSKRLPSLSTVSLMFGIWITFFSSSLFFPGELLIFYTIFYIGLCALFAICLKGLFLTIDLNEPKWKLSESLIGTNPGLGFRPIAHDVDQGSLIWYDSTNETQVDYWVDRVEDFLSGEQIKSDFWTISNSIPH